MSNKNHIIATQVYPCVLQQPLSDTMVLLHGWGSASNAWQPLIPSLQNIATVITIDLPGFGASQEISEFTLESVVELVAAALPEACVLIGWSLGGMLAVQIAARYPKKISYLITLAANAKFVTSHDYETAMSLSVNREFNKYFSTDSVAALKLFSGLLAQGDINERTLLKKVRSLSSTEIINSNWLQALALLSRLDNREAFATLMQPGLHLLAEKDVLVPVSAAPALRALNSQQKVSVISSAAHAMHWSQPTLVVEKIKEFLLLPALDKKQVAHSFSRAASTYDSVAGLQRSVGGELLKKISGNPQAEIVIDLGCGTGYFTPQLQAQFPQALVVGVDIAEGMLQFARSNSYKKGVVILACGDTALDGQLLTAGSPLREDDDSLLKSVPFKADPIFCCGDAEQLPFANQSVDVIYSNFALQWCTNLPKLFAELHRILKPNGELIFTTLGPATLSELKSAWQHVDNRVHVNQFHERDAVLGDLQRQGFIDVELEHSPEIMEFENLSDLTRSLKALGAQNINRGRATGLTGRKKIQAFRQAYENFRSNNMLPATYDVFYIKAKTQ